MKNQLGFVAPLLLILIVAAAAGGYYVYKGKSSPPSPVKLLSSNYIYEDPRGYQMEFTKGWARPDKEVALKFPETSHYYYNGVWGKNGGNLAVYDNANTSEQWATAYSNKEGHAPGRLLSQHPIVLKNSSGTRFDSEVTTNGTAPIEKRTYRYVNVITAKNGKAFRIEFAIPKEIYNQQMADDLEQVLKSFEIL